MDDQSDAPLTVEEALNVVPALTAHKAYASGIVSTLVAFLGTLQIAIPDGITSSEWVSIALTTVLGAAAGFGITYVVPNRAK